MKSRSTSAVQLQQRTSICFAEPAILINNQKRVDISKFNGTLVSFSWAKTKMPSSECYNAIRGFAFPLWRPAKPGSDWRELHL